MNQQEKIGNADQRIKDDFFYNDIRSRWKSVPRKTWKRHSAFLVYRQQMEAQETERVTKES